MKTLPTPEQVIDLLSPALEICPDENYNSLTISFVKMNGVIGIDFGVYDRKNKVIHRGSSYDEVVKARDKFKPEAKRLERIAELQAEILKLQNYGEEKK